MPPDPKDTAMLRNKKAMLRILQNAGWTIQNLDGWCPLSNAFKVMQLPS